MKIVTKTYVSDFQMDAPDLFSIYFGVVRDSNLQRNKDELKRLEQLFTKEVEKFGQKMFDAGRNFEKSGGQI